MLNTEIRVLPTAKTEIKNRQRVKMFLGTSMNNTMVVLMSKDRLEPGETGLAQFRLMKPIAALPKDTFVISLLNVNTIIAGGYVIETAREKFRKVKTESLLSTLTALQKYDTNAYVDRIFDHLQGKLITAKMLSKQTGFPVSDFEALISSRVQKGDLFYAKGRGAIRQAHLDEVKRTFINILKEVFKKSPLKKNVSLAEVSKNSEFPIEEDLLKIVADILCQEGVIEHLEGGYIFASSQSGLDDHQEKLINHLLRHAELSGVTPFSADTFWKKNRSIYTKAEITQLLNFLFSRKRLVRLNDHRFLSLQAIEEIKERVKQGIERKGFVTVNDCKELFGYGRWGGTHVLDYLNAIKFTSRKDDKHYLKK
jgi:selenocysteine-specific elongation factor